MQMEALNKAMEPKLTPEEQAAKEAAEAAYEVEVLEEKWDSWGTSPEAQAQQAAMMELMSEFEG